jgi:FkbM family methyltransferase
MYWRLLLKLNIDIEKAIKYDLETIDVMKRSLKKNSNCIDVGCNQGKILKDMLKFAPNGRHYAFEPIPELYQDLLSKFPNVKISNIALSDTKGELTFYDIVNRRALSGFKSRNMEQSKKVREITVQTDLLDNLIPDDLPIHLIKIDVEGAELQVLKGAINTIRKNKPIVIFEHGIGGADFYKTSPKDVHDLLVKECGLRISLMGDWLKHKNLSMSQEEFADQFYQHRNFYFLAYN